MEIPELRVGGWEKEGRGKWFKRIFSLILISFLGFLIIGPSLIDNDFHSFTSSKIEVEVVTETRTSSECLVNSVSSYRNRYHL